MYGSSRRWSRTTNTMPRNPSRPTTIHTDWSRASVGLEPVDLGQAERAQERGQRQEPRVGSRQAGAHADVGQAEDAEEHPGVGQRGARDLVLAGRVDREEADCGEHPDPGEVPELAHPCRPHGLATSYGRRTWCALDSERSVWSNSVLALVGRKRHVAHARLVDHVVEVDAERQLDRHALVDRDPPGRRVGPDEMARAQPDRAGDRQHEHQDDGRDPQQRPPEPASRAGLGRPGAPGRRLLVDVRRQDAVDAPAGGDVLVGLRGRLPEADDDRGDVVLAARPRAPPGRAGGRCRPRRSATPGRPRCPARRPSCSGRRCTGAATSPGFDSSVKVSICTSSSVPSARVITLRCGCCSASTSESWPLRTSSCTSEWSSESRWRAPSRRRYARLSPTWRERDGAVLADQRRGHRRAHAGRLGVGARALVDALVRHADRRPQRLLALVLDQVELGERLGAHARRELAGERAAHAVGHHEERRAQEERVLVGAANVAGLGQAGRIDDVELSSAGSVLELRLADRDDVAALKAAAGPRLGRRSRTSRWSSSDPRPRPRPGRGRTGHGGRKHTHRPRAGYRGPRHARRRGRARDRSRFRAGSSGLATTSEPRPPPGRRLERRGPLGGRQHHALLADRDVARGDADHAPDEQVEKDDERDLEREQELLNQCGART